MANAQTENNTHHGNQKDTIDTTNEIIAQEAMELSKNKNIWIDSLLLNYTEELEFSVPDPACPGKDKRICRRLSVGITAKSDNRTRIRTLHYAASQSLTYLLNEERKKWLNEEAMKTELEKTKQELESKIEEGNEENREEHMSAASR